MKIIELTQGQSSIVCDCHYHLVSKRKWIAAWDTHKKQFRAVRKATANEKSLGMPSTICMHREINNTPNGFQTDHIDNDSLNNQCSNLRTATREQNMWNRKRNTNSKSGFKGVTWKRKDSAWEASITTNGKRIYLGSFKNIIDAARAYDIAARTYHGEFALVNFG